VIGDATYSPVLIYPSDGTTFPQGVASTLVQYTSGTSNDAFRISFDSDVLHLAVFTGASRWSADAMTWSLVAASGISGPIAVGVEATASTGSGTVYGSASIALAFSRDAPTDTIYYWSAATSGLMAGTLGTTAAGKAYPSDGTCVGCHAIARDGTQLAVGYGNEMMPMLQTIGLPSLATIVSASAKVPSGWSAFSPDHRRVLVANAGVLALYDSATGAPVGPGGGRVMLPPMTFATHPDWSPDGTHVVVALTKMAPSNLDVNGASIARLPVMGDRFGPPQVLVPAAGMDNDYFPRYSPDGRWIAYVHATQSSKGALSAELWLVAANGGAPVALRLASHRVASIDDVGSVADTMPTWATTAGDHAWLAFASSRAYGAVVPAGRAQIWIAAVALGATGDPSSTAFWLPCQNVAAVNNDPVWARSMTVTPQ
jgi:TolB protein